MRANDSNHSVMLDAVNRGKRRKVRIECHENTLLLVRITKKNLVARVGVPFGDAFDVMSRFAKVRGEPIRQAVVE